MKWFLQFLSFGSVILYTLLVIIDYRISDGIADNTVAREAHSNQHQLSAWGPYLLNRSPGQDRQASTTTQPTHQQNAALAPKPWRLSPRQYFDDQPTSDNHGARIGKPPASLPMSGGSFEPSVPSEGKEAIWFVVSRAARLHAGPSVSSRITHFYPVGSELKLVAHERGWFQVSDPATSRQGWIYDKYYLDAIRGPGQTQLAVQDLPSTTRVALAAPKPKPVSRVKKPRPQQKIAKSRPQPSKRIPRHNDFASLIERAFRGY
jgi:hypothetical protein